MRDERFEEQIISIGKLYLEGLIDVPKIIPKSWTCSIRYIYGFTNTTRFIIFLLFSVGSFNIKSNRVWVGSFY